MKNKIILGLILIFAVMQLFRPEQIPFQEPTTADLFAVEESSEELKTLIQNACYNCHSNQIDYPWYTSVAPISWWTYDHMEHGREHLNFSEWASYTAKKKAHKAEEVVEEVEEEEMPLDSYMLMHQDANLSDEERKQIMDWFASIEKRYQ